jgi:hypothetical protein
MFLTVAFTFALLLAFPLMVAASVPAIVNMSLDRTTVTPGQNITVAVRTTTQTNYVFAMVDGSRTNGSRVNTAANHVDWTITVPAPSRNADVTIFASATGNETGAANIRVPVTVTASTANETTTVTNQVTTGASGPVAIQSVTETPATGANMVQLTVVTGPEANYVWIRFEGDRYAQGTRTANDSGSRTWVINYRPATMQAHQVQVGSNRVYAYRGASLRNFDVTLSAPFVAPSRPAIQNVDITRRDVSINDSTTVNIRTNLDATDVWIRDADGREFTATRGSSTSSSINWSVTFNPDRSGNIQIFANTSRSETNATRRSENISVRDGRNPAAIFSANADNWGTGQLVITARTNANTNTVWAEFDGRTVQLSRTNQGSGNERHWEWSGNVNWNWNWNNQWNTNVRVRASSQTGNVNSMSSEDSRTAAWGGTNWGNNNNNNWFGHFVVPDVHVTVGGATMSSQTPIRAGDTISFTVSTAAGSFPSAILTGPWNTSIERSMATFAGRWEARIDFTIPSTAPVGAHVFTIHTHQNFNTIGSRNVTIDIVS